jgi:hypothetical protein
MMQDASDVLKNAGLKAGDSTQTNISASKQAQQQ